ncbi:MAG: replication initiation protein [Saprospiraceae bacterium]
MTKKLTKKKGGEVSFVRKANDLVEGKYKFDIWEMRIFTKMVTLIQHDDKAFKEYKIYLKDIIQYFGLQRDGRNYQHLKDSALRLMSRIVKVVVKDVDGFQELNTPIVGAVKNPLYNDEDDDNVYIKISFHPDLKPFLLDLKSKYVVYDARNILRLPSTYSIRIYELLKQYEKIGKRRLSVQELKEMFGVTTEYRLYANFKQRIIEKAQRDLEEHTDISFTFEEIKDGRAVVELIFYIHANQPKHQEAETHYHRSRSRKPIITNQGELFPQVREEETHIIYNTTESLFFHEISEEIAELGIDREVLKLLIETQPEEAIRNGAEYTRMSRKSGKVKENISGFFIAAVKNKFTSKDFEQLQLKKKRAQEENEKAKQKRNDLMVLEQLRDEYEALRNNIIRELTTTDNSLLINAVEFVRHEKSIVAYANLKNIVLSTLDIDEYRKDQVLRSAVIRAIQKLVPEEFVILDDYLLKIRELEQKTK